MPTVYQHPGVYINEVSGGSKPIEGVGTSTAAFIGFTPAGPANKPIRVTSWLEFARVFGDPEPGVKTGPYLKNAYLAHAVNGFFANGGGACYIVRLGIDDYGGLPQIGLQGTADNAPELFKFVRRSLLRADDGTLKIGKDGKPQALVHPDIAHDKKDPTHISVTIVADDPDGVSAALDAQKGAGEAYADAVKAAENDASDAKAKSAASISATTTAAKAAKALADAKAAQDEANAAAAKPDAGDDAKKAAADAKANTDAAVKTAGDADKEATDARKAADDAADKAKASAAAKKAAQVNLAKVTAPVPTYTLTVKDAAGDSLSGKAAEPYTQTYAGVTVAPGPKYLPQIVNGDPDRLVDVMDLGETLPASQRVLDVKSVASGTDLALAAGDPPDVDAVPVEGPDDLKGDPVQKTGLGGLAGIDEITMVAVPDLMAMQPTEPQIRDVHSVLNTYCSSGQIKRMAILDPPPGLNKQDIAAWRDDPATPSSNFAVLYWPWIEVMDPFSQKPMLVPPCGHMAGVWAGTDTARGVHKAPANVAVQAAIGVASEITDGDQDALNPEGINCIRTFPGSGIRVWGARTLSNDPEWRYINVRRLFNYVSASILKGTQWAVFEPNDEFLWGQLEVAVGNFLLGVWRGGALFGSTPGDAFFVKCDSSTNPQDLIDSGQVNIQIGIAPVKPAEFVIFQISQYTAPPS
jgi:uncharacterized protein